MSARARCCASEPSPGPASVTRSRMRRDRVGATALAGSRSQIVARQSRSRRKPPKRAQEQPQGAALLLVREHDLGRPIVLRGPALEIRTRADHGVVAREVALDQVAGRRVARRAAVEAPKEQLHHLARHLRRHEALGGRVERADVQRSRVSQSGRRGARRKRLVHVHEVELGPVEEILQRARHVERHRHRAGAPEWKRLPDRDHGGAALLGPQRLRIGVQRPDLGAALPHELARVGRRNHDHAVPA